MEKDQSIATPCPSCESRNGFVFYRVPDVPVHSCVLLESEAEAQRFPRHRIELAFCRSCGFIYNAAFESNRVDYSQPYEDQQSFSATFDSFATDLARRLVSSYTLTGKTIIEVGCGKGDFLTLLCRLGDNHGIGIDPALREDRIPEDVAPRISCIRDYFGPQHTGLRGDFVCCRHTLEHVSDTLRFVTQVRELCDRNSRAPVFFEVPDTKRVLEEAAFWDVYYEHCSYFTTASLRHLFERAGFSVERVELAYGGQYLLLEGLPRNGIASASPDAREVHLLEEAVARFSGKVTERVRHWREKLESLSQAKKRVAIWGAGSKAVGFLTTLGAADQIGMLVDINPHRQGRYLPGVARRISAPEELREYRPDFVIVMNPIYRDEIAAQLRWWGLDPELMAP
jgi:SAM-dependent methyltransferase